MVAGWDHGYNCDREGSSRREARFERRVHMLVVPNLFDHLSHTITTYYPPLILLSVSPPPRMRDDWCLTVSYESGYGLLCNRDARIVIVRICVDVSRLVSSKHWW